MNEVIHTPKKLTSFQIIILGFLGVILLGSFLLMLPISSKEGIFTPFHEALFTATSAVCVTGLVVKDTATYWSLFGQFVILLLIQIGGLGVVTIAVSFALLSGKKISLMQRSTMQEAIAAHKVGGIVRLTGFILKATFLIELIGALIMMPIFCKKYDLLGVWMALFHSISAFCNAGFDILGTTNAVFPSLTSYAADPVITTTIMLLIIIGGIGFLTWEDICIHKHHFHHYHMQSKVILVTTLFLIVIPTVFFAIHEFYDLPAQERLLKSLFQAVTPRTAGFNTVDLTAMSSAAQTILIILMLIGGAPGSTAGGMKTTTFAVLIGNCLAIFQRRDHINFFGRRVEEATIKNASTILSMYICLFVGGALLISIIEGLPMGVCLFETASAVGTVGLTLGITPQLSIFSQSILIILMFLGRVGGLTLIYATISSNHKHLSKLPQGKITVG
ncbi:MAG: Trk family potassium uptake protein [Erysipelotrichaceae bacterium]|nr:Trk family potassium uptake protein [Erysipelotrichaceae bacterium]